MKSPASDNFGLAIAYLLPGFVALGGASYLSPTVRYWLAGGPPQTPTVGGFLYVTLASLGAGVTLSTVRWLVLDTLHHATGVRPPAWDFARLRENNVAAFRLLVSIHYDYYKFHGNLLVALIVVYLVRRAHHGFWSAPIGWTDAVFFALACVLLAGSRDTLKKYYDRAGQLLAPAASVGEAPAAQGQSETSNGDSEGPRSPAS